MATIPDSNAQQEMMEVAVVQNVTQIYAKLQTDTHHHNTNTQILQVRCPSGRQVNSVKDRDSYSRHPVVG